MADPGQAVHSSPFFRKIVEIQRFSLRAATSDAMSVISTYRAGNGLGICETKMVEALEPDELTKTQGTVNCLGLETVIKFNAPVHHPLKGRAFTIK